MIFLILFIFSQALTLEQALLWQEIHLQELVILHLPPTRDSSVHK